MRSPPSSPGERITTLHSSQLRRALETAEIVGEALGFEPRVDVRFAESRRGEWEDRLVSDIKREERELWRAWKRAEASFRFPGGESLEEHQRRVVAGLADVARGPLPALVVCHAGTIRCAYCHHHHPAGLDAFRELAVPSCGILRLDAAETAQLSTFR